MSEEKKKSKGKRGRSKKFESESKVVSFRIQKDVYEGNKDEIREKINGVIENEVDTINRKSDVKKQVKHISRSFLRNKPSKKETKGLEGLNIDSTVKSESIVNKVESKPTINKTIKLNPVEEEIEKKKREEELEKFYYAKKGEIKEKVKKIAGTIDLETESSKKKKGMNKEDIFNEFKDFIDIDDDEFEEFRD